MLLHSIEQLVFTHVLKLSHPVSSDLCNWPGDFLKSFIKKNIIVDRVIAKKKWSTKRLLTIGGIA
ncbi:MAG TPA: hypothetical protein VLD19_04235, partial [Chitinophagaceae bacterium]|nr:hypothetical protein [Chitinophagaceae bacterium]